MHFVEKDLAQKRIDLDNKLKSNKILRVPGAYNPLTAKLIEEIGYDAVYVSGGVMANDLGFRYWFNNSARCSTRSYLISRATNLPTIVDIDTDLNHAKKQLRHLKNLELLLFIWKIKLNRKDVVIWITKNLSQKRKWLIR